MGAPLKRRHRGTRLRLRVLTGVIAAKLPFAHTSRPLENARPTGSSTTSSQGQKTCGSHRGDSAAPPHHNGFASVLRDKPRLVVAAVQLANLDGLWHPHGCWRCFNCIWAVGLARISTVRAPELRMLAFGFEGTSSTPRSRCGRKRCAVTCARASRRKIKETWI